MLIFCNLPPGDYLGMKYQNVILIYFTLPHGIRRSFWKTDPNPPLTQRLFLSKGKMLGQGKGRWVIS